MTTASDDVHLQSNVLLSHYQRVRHLSRTLTAPLSAEDMQLQSMEDASPTKWHLAHTTWFFETFVLAPRLRGYSLFHPDYHHLFNSYYNSLGQPFLRPRRGMLSRPQLDDILQYRDYVDAAMEELLESGADEELQELLVLGLHHEQQHQELILTDIKHALAINPLKPVYQDATDLGESAAPPLSWVDFAGGEHHIGHDSDGFCFDNDLPRHAVLLQDFRLASRPVTNGEFAQFIADGGYDEPLLWLSDGWAHINRERQRAPLYWEWRDDQWWAFTLNGLRRLDPEEPVSHINFYEAFAYANWAGQRLPTEAEWEVAARGQPIEGRFVDSGCYHPRAAQPGSGPLLQLYGDVWEWTASSYSPYPGYRPSAGAIGEYNGKFMCNQLVLRGGSCATSQSHIRPSYRNFFYPHQSWQFTGLRLAEDG